MSEFRTIREVCSVVVDCPHSTPKWTTTGKIVIRNNNIKHGKIDLSSPSYTDEKHFEHRIKRAKPQPGDLIITREAPIGEVGMIPENTECCLGQRMVLLRADESVCDNFYLLYSLQSVYVQHQISWSEGTGTTVSNLRIPHLEQIRIPYLPLKQQKQISSILRVLEWKIENNRILNDNLEQQTKALYQSWFVDYTPFEGIIPEGWHMGTLSDLADAIICGKTPSTKHSEYYGNEVPFITIPDMHNQIYAVSTERSLSTVGVASQPGKMLPPNSTCVSCIGTAGLVCLVAEPSQTNQQINSIVPSPNVSPYYIYLLAKSLSDKIQNLGSGGSTICNLNKGQFSAIEALIPSVESMWEFDKIVGPLFEAIYINQIENLRLAELRDTLLPRLMSGELDVSDIDL